MVVIIKNRTSLFDLFVHHDCQRVFLQPYHLLEQLLIYETLEFPGLDGRIQGVLL